MSKNLLNLFQLNKSIVFSLMLIFCILQLSACFPVIATSIVASAVAVTDRRTAGIIVEDETIEIKFLSENKITFIDTSPFLISYIKNKGNIDELFLLDGHYSFKGDSLIALSIYNDIHKFKL